MNADYNRTEDVSLEHICNWMSCCTRHNSMDVHQYVHADVLSHVSDAWMFYDIHYRSMDVHHYVHVYVPSDVQATWMFYYTP